jgi:hypothetical protein
MYSDIYIHDWPSPVYLLVSKYNCSHAYFGNIYTCRAWISVPLNSPLVIINIYAMPARTDRQCLACTEAQIIACPYNVVNCARYTPPAGSTCKRAVHTIALGKLVIADKQWPSTCPSISWVPVFDRVELYFDSALSTYRLSTFYLHTSIIYNISSEFMGLISLVVNQ